MESDASCRRRRAKRGSWPAPRPPRTRRRRETAYGLGAGLLLLLTVGTPGATAQASPGTTSGTTPPRLSWRLNVRPQQMATGKRTARAGEQPLGVSTAYVPKACVGTRRCPLLVMPGHRPAFEVHLPWAEQYGVILLLVDMEGGLSADTVFAHLEAGLRQALGTFAVDPQKIAITAISTPGAFAAVVGYNNLDIFSRVAILDRAFMEGVPEPQELQPPGPRNSHAQFYFSGNIDYMSRTVHMAEYVRAAGYPSIKTVVDLRLHAQPPETLEALWRWLHDSWTTPAPAPPAPVVVDSFPELTAEALGRLSAFWWRFTHEPDSIATAARRAHLTEVVVPVGHRRGTVMLTDLPALAARYPAVAADLKQAELTATEAQAYRLALISAMATIVGSDMAGPRGMIYSTPHDLDVFGPVATSASNVAWLLAHPKKMRVLMDATTLFRIP